MYSSSNSVEGEIFFSLVIFKSSAESLSNARSKFICSIKPVLDEVDAKKFIDTIKKKHSLATHNCYAYIADDKGLIQKFSDDGEPQGTAGLPMLEVLKNKRMFKTVAVVTRYFGGIKLGTGGLTKAYGNSVVECLNTSKILQMEDAMIYILIQLPPLNVFILAMVVQENIPLLLKIKRTLLSMGRARSLYFTVKFRHLIL